MRVTHVITRLIIGGAQENTVASVLGLRLATGWDINLISGPTYGPEGSLESLFANNPQTLIIVPELVRPIRPGKDARAFASLTRLFRSLSPRIVHTHSGKAGILGRIAAARARVPLIVHTVHGPSFGRFQGALSNLVFGMAERLAGKVTSHFVVVADAMKQQYLAAGIGTPEQYTRIYSGFDLQTFESASNNPSVRARFGLKPDDVVVGMIARLFQLKGHDDLFAIAADLVRSCPRLKFLLVGDGEWRARFEDQARRLGLAEHFIFAGLVSPQEVPEFVGIMDVLIHLSLREGLPRALPQALAAGKPIVAYDCDGAREVCLDGQTGFLLPAGDLGGLRERLLLLAADPHLRQRLGRAGQSFVHQRFGVDRMVGELQALYERLTEPHVAARRP
jgi:glycosyltransferase involved in cell wall biosynthesis